MNSNPLQGWIPSHLDEDGQVRWLYTGHQRFEHPFFDETMAACLKLAPNSQGRRVVSSLPFLLEHQPQDVARPAAVIFHVSRCGSTLISQVLGMHPAVISLAEVPFFDALLSRQKDTGTAAFLPAALGFYCARRTGSEEQVIIKTDSWHLSHFKSYRNLLPGVPFFILYREPLAILRSHMRQKGRQAVPGLVPPGVLGLDDSLGRSVHPHDYMALVLEQYYGMILELAAEPNTSLLSYSEGIGDHLWKISQATGLVWSLDDYRAAVARSRYHAKDAARPFSGDGTAQVYCPRVLSELYESIEALRQAQLIQDEAGQQGCSLLHGCDSGINDQCR